MSVHRDGIAGIRPDARALLARAAAADVRADRRLATAIDDMLLSDEDRIDDRTRATIAAALRDTVGGMACTIRGAAARLLRERGAGAAAARLKEAPDILARLSAAGLLRDPEWMGELIGRTTQAMVAAGLGAVAPDDADQPSLLVRLTGSINPSVAGAARALLLADSRAGGALPEALHDRLGWWVAAALGEDAGGDPAGAIDRALIDATLEALAAHDGDARGEAAAMDLAAAIGADSDELPALIVEAIGDRRLALFIALLARALEVEYEAARALVLDPGGDRLWLVLRALDVPRGGIARIGLMLAEADPRRDLNDLPDTIDTVMAILPQDAHVAIGPLALHRDYRQAVRTLAERRVPA